MKKEFKRLNIFRNILIVIDVLAVLMFIFELIIKDINYSSYIVLLINNILVFSLIIYKKRLLK